MGKPDDKKENKSDLKQQPHLKANVFSMGALGLLELLSLWILKLYNSCVFTSVPTVPSDSVGRESCVRLSGDVVPVPPG